LLNILIVLCIVLTNSLTRKRVRENPPYGRINSDYIIRSIIYNEKRRWDVTDITILIPVTRKNDTGIVIEHQ